MTRHHSASILLASLFLAGCAYSGGPIGSLPPPKNPSQAGTLIISRNHSPVGIFGTMYVTLNGKPLYRLGMGQSYSVKLDSGEYLMGYSIGLNDCSGVVSIRPGQTRRIRLAPNCLMHRE
ncbi:hypothetical protein G3480_15435 [Thiorhodococcus mannitoliphagus]|uniref:Uncharacterized protein n=1 Tax=Thiorhodococcus mannitoliphagus TaxID=329406 RepID=A0A6P1DTN7_9GAMM|nr:hypothetical protein [Thiorhodococcus mannitoliphagus]NEX21687.1 hypothetical protein [Thiorhodococcus mannitoliphagus]